ncbi:tripartite tricarboxylate transporter substrate binding protein [Comamonas sp.]|uniref:Bug family tripartite tricarboxylate transporter substrate binding protein n=1 Tax=Comamonas sp. TaxID=34028 RepID=UPI0012D0FAE9|nr:tripartite tricarboxylate transporter substrate binding protein [Comamonas sp.]MPT11140.1 tripartite tricarboxylate transporter substrate binding protein [Comamonas sp.]
MTHLVSRSRRAVTTLLAGMALSGLAQAAGFSAKPITIVVAFPAGGDTDVLARILAEKLTPRLGQPVIVENRTGGSGVIGTTFVARSQPDGHTLLLAPNTIAITPHVLQTSAAKINPAQDLTPITQLASQSLFVVVEKSTGVNSIKELISSNKAGKLQTYASPGSGTPMHILAELFDKAAGTKFQQIPYRGSAPAIADLIGKHVPLMYSTLGPMEQHLKAGSLKALAVADAVRSPFLPQVPTLAELDYPSAQVGAWQALFGPKNMPADVVETINKHCNEILKMPEVVERMTTMSIQAKGGTPAQMQALAQSDYEKYSKLVKEFNIRAD